MLFLASIGILSLSLIIAGSRTGLLGAALAMAVILTMMWKRYSAVKGHLIVWLLVFFIGTAGGFYLLSIKDDLGIEKLTKKQIEWLADKGATSYGERILMYKTSLEMFKEKPLFGQGFSNFGSFYMYYQGKIAKSEPKYKEVIGDYASHPHNELFLIISESGIAGAAAVLIVIYGFLKAVMRLGKERAGLYTALLTPLIIHTLVEYPLQLSTAHYLLFVILIYMASSHSLNATQLRLSPFMAKAAVMVFSGIYMVFLTYTVMTLNSYNGLVRWYIDYTETGRGEDKDILPSTGNIYLRNLARPMHMFTKAEKAVEDVEDVEKNEAFLNDFLKWSNLEKQRLPVFPVFYYDARVLFAMGIHYKQHAYFDEAMKTVEQWLLRRNVARGPRAHYRCGDRSGRDFPERCRRR